MSIFRRLFGDLNSREVGRYESLIRIVNERESELEQKSDDELRQAAKQLKEKVSREAEQILADTVSTYDPKARLERRRQLLTDLLNQEKAYSFALTREAAKRAIGLRHYDVQLIGGAVLHEGKIAEMQTGEGKTLVASLPLVLNALTGLGAHLVTVNDYLARRDAGWMGPLYIALGLSVGVIGPQFSYLYDPNFTNEESDVRLTHLRPVSRADAYRADITYGTNNEFGFDYLRDHMVGEVDQLSQRDLVYAIVDEVDSILIDEARTPLIISSFSHEAADHYRQVAEHMPKLSAETDYTIEEKNRNVSLTDGGIKKLEQLIGVANLYDPNNVALVHYVDTSLKAYTLYKKNRDYVVKDGQVIIVDEFTGRMLVGRRYSSGLHQAIEAKEKVAVQEESVTLATVTFQNYFRLYIKLAGMTGTASTEAEEFSKIYHLEVVSVPTNRPSQRTDYQDLIYKTETAKFEAIASKIKEVQALGQPILIGTVSIAKSEKLSKLMKTHNINHAVLNAKQHQKEGEIVAQAGRIGAVTVATNMAGRGVDIILGGSPPNDANVTQIKEWEKDHQSVLKLGGLMVIGTERHESRRIDNQLRGRSGRQGDPGVSQFYVSMEDDLMRIFGGDRMKNLMERLNVPEDMSINNPLLSRALEQAQSKVEGHNFDIRKQLVEYDDVTNKQREAIYRRRETILQANETDAASIHEAAVQLMTDEQRSSYTERSQHWGPMATLAIERAISLRAIDILWVEHLKNLEDLRESIGLRGYGQRDPIVEYKQEAYRLFHALEAAIDDQIVQMLLHVEANIGDPEPVPVEQPSKKLHFSGTDESQPVAQIAHDKTGRNDPCPCGAIDPQTGKVYKFKKCGLVNAPHHRG